MPKGERRVIELSYAPTAPEQLGGHRIKCQVCHLRQQQGRVDFDATHPDQMLHANTPVGSSNQHSLPSVCICFFEQVINGPTYVLALSGSGYKPKLNLSFLSYDFGPCHIFQQGMTAAVAKLLITNEDRQPISFDAVFDNNENWQVRPPVWLCRVSVRAELHPPLQALSSTCMHSAFPSPASACTQLDVRAASLFKSASQPSA